MRINRLNAILVLLPLLTPALLAQGVDLVGNSGNTATGTGLAKGNSYRVDTQVTLTQAEFWLTFTGPQTLNFYVYQAPAEYGPYTQIYTSSASITGTGSAWYSAPPLSILMNVGDYYMIAISWPGTLTYYFGAADTWPVSFGAHTHAYASGRHPLPATIPTTSNDQAVYYQRITTQYPAGLYADFSASPASGLTPLAVQFTDTTYTSDPGGVTSWAWDFESDGIVDSTIQNPLATYNVCGYYDVTLTVTDSMHSPSTESKPGFIQADPQLLVNANFLATPTGGAPPLQVQFTDASTGSPTSWDWDLDGDGITDSTLQNPTFTYNVGGGYTVSLTATNACGSDTETRPGFIFVMTNDECSGAIPVTFGTSGPFNTTAATPSAPAWPCAEVAAPICGSPSPRPATAMWTSTCAGAAMTRPSRSSAARAAR